MLVQKKELCRQFLFVTGKSMRPVGEMTGEMWCKMYDFDNELP